MDVLLGALTVIGLLAMGVAFVSSFLGGLK
jgi:hypothetical protein